MIKSLLALGLIFTVTLGSAQTHYLSGWTKNGGKKTYQTGDRVKIKLADGDKFIGQLGQISADSFQIRKFKFHIAEVKWIKQLEAVNQYLAYPFKGYGSLYMIAGTALFTSETFNRDEESSFFAPVGIVIALAGGAFYGLGEAISHKPKTVEDIKIESLN